MTHVIEVRFVSLSAGDGVEVETPYGTVFIGCYPDCATVELQDGRVISLTNAAEQPAAPGEGS